MKIVIEIDGNQVTPFGPCGDTSLPAPHAPPGPAPAALLERARKLGAFSAGAAQLGTGAALAATAEFGHSIKLPAPHPHETAKPPKAARKKRGRRS